MVFLVAFVGSLVALPESAVASLSPVIGLAGASRHARSVSGWDRPCLLRLATIVARPAPGSYPAARTAAIARLNRESRICGVLSASESLVNLWARFFTSDIVFGAMLGTVSTMFGPSRKPWECRCLACSFSREAFANAGYEDKRSPNQLLRTQTLDIN